MDEIQIALQIEEVAKIISGAPFPSKKSLSKAREVVEFLSNRAALTIPEGFVLVPTVLPETMLDALYCAESDMSDDDMQKLWQQLLAARPEVK